MSEPLLVAEGLRKNYVVGSTEIQVLRGLDLTLSEGESVAVVGASGVGKSTLLHLLGLLDTPDEGTVHHRGEDLFRLSPRQRAERRNLAFGFIFQFYHLIPELSALDNTLLPSLMGWGRAEPDRRDRARSILTELGLEERLRHRPSQLSGGERQRVAIARALMNDPDVLLCDEPTGNLDPETSVGVQDALWGVHESRGQAILLVTHDGNLARRADRVVRMKEGRLVPERGAD
jgi:lipoprotein-releasing system ATP-binding protein